MQFFSENQNYVSCRNSYEEENFHYGVWINIELSQESKMNINNKHEKLVQKLGIFFFFYITKQQGKIWKDLKINKALQMKKKKERQAIPVSRVRMIQAQATFVNDEFFMLLHYGSSHVSCMI